MVGDGKSPNKYFVTIGFGWYIPYKEYDKDSDEPFEMPDMIQAPNSIESVTMGPFNKQEAEDLFEMIELPKYPVKVNGTTIGQVTMEDRNTGVVKEKGLWELRKGHFIEDNR